MIVYNSTRNNIIASDGKIAKNYMERIIGLISKKEMSKEEFLVINPCFSIHTFFMKFPIDVLFVDKKNKIVGLYKNVLPNRVLPIHLTSDYVVELASGTIESKNIQKNDVISIQNS